VQRKEYQAITRIRRYYEDTEVAEQVSADIKLCYTHHIHKTTSRVQSQTSPSSDIKRQTQQIHRTTA